MNNNTQVKRLPIFEYLLFLTILLLPFYLVRFSIGPIPTTLLEIFIYVSFIVGIITKRIRVASWRVFAAALVFVLSGFLAIFFDSDVLRAGGLFKAYFFDGILLYLMVSSLEREERNKAFVLLAISAAITAIAALWFFLSGTKSQDGRMLDLDRLSPNYLSMYLVPAAIALVYLIFKNVKDKQRTMYFAFCLLLVAVALYLTGSRGVYLSLPIGLIVLGFVFVKKQYQKSYKYLSLTAALLILLGGLWFFRPSFGDMGRTGSSSNIRYYIWTTSFEIAKKNPIFGIGLSNFQDYFTELTRGRINYSEFIAPQALTAHNLYLHLYLTAGVLGLFSFLALVAIAILRSKNIVIIAMMAAVLVYGLVDVPFFRNDLAGMFWVLLALL